MTMKQRLNNPMMALIDQMKPLGLTLVSGVVSAVNAGTIDFDIDGVTIPNVPYIGPPPSVSDQLWAFRIGTTVLPLNVEDSHDHDLDYEALGHNHDLAYLALSGGTMAGNVDMDGNTLDDTGLIVVRDVSDYSDIQGRGTYVRLMASDGAASGAVLIVQGQDAASQYLRFFTDDGEQFRIDSAGNAWIAGNRLYFDDTPGQGNDWIDLIDANKAFRVVVDGGVKMLVDADVAGSGFQVLGKYMQRVVEFDSLVSTTVPGTALTDVVTKTVTVEADKPVHVAIQGLVRASDVDENEIIGAYCIIDGDAVGQVTYQGFGNVTGSSVQTGTHDHSNPSNIDDGNHSHTITVSVADQYVTANSQHARTFTPTGTTIELKLQGYRSTTGIATFRNVLTWQVWQDV